MAKTEVGAEDATKDKGCFFEEIKIQENIDDKDVETCLYKKDSDFDRKEYIVIAGREKKVKFTNQRNKEQCPLMESHNKIGVNKDEINYKNQCDVTVGFPYEPWVASCPSFELLSYIWPSEKDFTPYNVKLKSCGNAKDITLKVYPDVQWALVFSVGTSNPLGIKWKEWNRGDATYAPPASHSTAGKIGADARYGKEVTFDLEFSAKKNNGEEEDSLKAKYEHRFKELSNFLAKCKDPMNAILGKTGGSIPGTKIECPSPVISLSGQWQLCKNSDSTEIGKRIEIDFNADPLIGITVTINLLEVGLFAVNPGAYKIYETVKKAINSTDFLKSDMYINLIISGIIECGINASFCTIKEEKKKGKNDNIIKADLDAVISLELSAGVYIKAKIVLLFIEAEGEIDASISGKASLRFGAGFEYDDEGLFFIPTAIFEGLKVTAIFHISVGLSIKQPTEEESDIDFDNDHTKNLVNIDKEFVIIKSFDFIKELAGKEIKIALMSNENNQKK